MMKPNWNGMRNIRTRPQVLGQIFSGEPPPLPSTDGSGDCTPCRGLMHRLDLFGPFDFAQGKTFAQGRLSIAIHEHGCLSVDGGFGEPPLPDVNLLDHLY
jgi:hypothetical protein